MLLRRAADVRVVLAQGRLSVGSKRFTESYVLGEIVTQTAAKAGAAQAVHQQGMGSTGILHAALKAGAIHVYPEYTGTIAFELLGMKRVPPLAELTGCWRPTASRSACRSASPTATRSRWLRRRRRRSA